MCGPDGASPVPTERASARDPAGASCVGASVRGRAGASVRGCAGAFRWGQAGASTRNLGETPSSGAVALAAGTSASTNGVAGQCSTTTSALPPASALVQPLRSGLI